MEAIQFGNTLSTAVVIAFVVLAPIFIYYSMKSLLGHTEAKPYLQNEGIHLPLFLASQHVDRRRPVRDQYKWKLVKHSSRKSSKNRRNPSNSLQEHKQILGFCAVGLEHFEQINQSKTFWKQEPNISLIVDRMSLCPSSSERRKNFSPTQLTTILEDVEY